MLMLMLVMVMGDNDSSVPGRHDQSISGRSALAVQEVRGGGGTLCGTKSRCLETRCRWEAEVRGVWKLGMEGGTPWEVP